MEDDPPYDITFVLLTECAPVSLEPARRAIRAALKRHGKVAAKINVALVDDARIAELNETYLNHAGATDVLTFDLADSPVLPPVSPSASPSAPTSSPKASPQPLEGEVVVSVETASREALRRGQSIDAEVALYAVHGTLHLLGYDDQQPEAAIRMHELEDEILIAVGIGPVFRAGES